MSGHSKWSQIKHKKGLMDQKKAKVFSKISRALTVAAKEKGADPSVNPKLRLMIEKAREANVPQDNIEKAIKKAVGAASGENFEEVLYEAFGASGAAIIIEAITDSKNRTTGEIKHILNKYGAKLGAPGSALWAFEKTAEKNEWGPKHFAQITDKESKEKLKNLLAALENHDDIQNVSINADLD